MKKILILIIVTLFSQNIFADENLDKKAREINKKIRCVVCQSQSIDDSDSLLARDLRVLIKEKLKEGKTEKEITNYLVERYGEFILFKPRFNSNTYFLWLAPLIIIIFGLFWIKGIFKRN
tara:strand:- start:200 stop:559 length:360 start_codon:yes stop_codon:yes gene_type:complete